MKIKDWLHRFDTRKIALATSLAVMLALVISPGAYIQTAFFGLLDLDSATLYAAAYGDAINRSPRFFDWLLISTSPEFIVISVLVSVLAVTRKCRTNYLSAIWLGVAVGLTVTDIVSAAYADKLTATSLVKNMTANLLGALLVTSLAALAITLPRATLFNHHKLTAYALAPASIGFVCSIIVYFVLGIFTHLLPVSAILSLEGSVSGYFSRNAPNGSDHQNGNPFDLFPHDLRFDRLELRGSDDLAVRWERTKNDTKFSLSAYLVDTCWSTSDLGEEPNFPPIFQQDNVHSVGLEGDVTSKQLQILGAQSHLAIGGSPISSFSIESDQNLSSVNITEFLGEGASATAHTNAEVSIRLAGATLTRGDATTVLSPRHFILSVNGQNKNIELSPPSTLSDKEMNPCALLHGEADERGVFKLDDIVMGGLLLKIERTSVPVGYVNDTDSAINIENANGWLTIPNITIQDLQAAEGRIDFLTFRSPSSHVVINDKSVDISAGQHFVGFGDLYTRFRNDGVLLASGELQAAWNEGKRLNRTRWELLPIELKILLLTAFGTFVLWAMRLAVKIDWSDWGKKNLLDED